MTAGARSARPGGSHRDPRRRVAAFGLCALALFATTIGPPAARAHEPLGTSIEAVSAGIASAPGDANLRLRRAELRRLAGEFEAAEDDLNRAEFLAPGRADIALEQARLALDRGDPRGALAALGRDSGRAPSHPARDGATRDERGERAALRARSLAALGRTREAIAAWSAALPDLEHPQPDHYLERARLQLGEHRSLAAAAGLREGLARLGPATSLEAALAALGEGAGQAAAPRERGRGSESASGPAGAAVTISRGPYLQLATPGGITVRWRTSMASDARVWFGAAPGSYTGYADDPASSTEHVVTLTGLAPDTRYYYTVGPSSGALAGGDSLTFRTHPVAGAAVATRIWVLGDSGLPGANQDRVRDAFAGYTGARGADVWLMLGDNAYSSGLDTEYQGGLFTPYRAQLQRWPLWPTRGNHDALYAGANNDYYDHFTLPTAAEAGGAPSGSEAYYSFDYGPVHFICLDSEGTDRSPSSAMFTWLAGDLAANARAWTIAFWHHPPYTKGSHDSDDAFDSGGRMRDMRENALPLLEAAGVDLVLGGHSHCYERSFLLDGHYGVSGTLIPGMKKDAGDGRPDGNGAYGKPTPGSGPHEGAVYAVDGSGAQATGGALNHPAMVTSLNQLGSMVIDVAGDRLDARFLSDLGVVRDSFRIVKGAATAVPGGTLALDGMRLGPTLPNPFRWELSLSFTLGEAATVRLDLYDAAGRRVAALVRGRHEAGSHLARWDGRGENGLPLPAGIYVASLEAGGRRVTRRIALVR